MRHCSNPIMVENVGLLIFLRESASATAVPGAPRSSATAVPGAPGARGQFRHRNSATAYARPSATLALPATNPLRSRDNFAYHIRATAVWKIMCS